MGFFVPLDYLVVQKSHQLLKSVSIHEEASVPQAVLNKQICGPYKRNLGSYINNGPNCATQYIQILQVSILLEIYHSSILVFQTLVLLFFSLLVFLYFSILVFQYSSSLVFQYSSILVVYQSSILVFWYSSILVFQYSSHQNRAISTSLDH